MEGFKKLLNFFNAAKKSPNSTDNSSSSQQSSNPNEKQSNFEQIDKKELLNFLKAIKEQDPCSDEELNNLLEYFKFYVEKYTLKKVTHLKIEDYYLGHEVIAELFLVLRKISLAKLGTKVHRGQQFNAKITKSIAKHEGGATLQMLFDCMKKISDSLNKNKPAAKKEKMQHKETVLINALSALWVLTRSDDINKALSDANAVTTLLSVLTAHAQKRDIIIPLLASLGNLTSIKENHAKFSAEECLKRLNEIYKIHSLDAQVIEKYALIVMNCAVSSSFKNLFFNNGVGFDILLEIIQRFIGIDVKFSFFLDGIQSPEKNNRDPEDDSAIYYEEKKQKDRKPQNTRKQKREFDPSGALTELEKTKIEVATMRENEFFASRQESIAPAKIDISIMVFGAIRNLLHKSDQIVKYFLNHNGLATMKSALYQTKNSDVIEQIVAALRNISVFPDISVTTNVGPLMNTLLLIAEDYFPHAFSQTQIPSAIDALGENIQRLLDVEGTTGENAGTLQRLQQQLEQFRNEQTSRANNLDDDTDKAKNAEDIIDHCLCSLRNFVSPQMSQMYQVFSTVKGIPRTLDLLGKTLGPEKNHDPTRGEDSDDDFDDDDDSPLPYNQQVIQNEVLLVLMTYCKNRACSDEFLKNEGYSTVKRVKILIRDTDVSASDECLKKVMNGLFFKWTSLLELLSKRSQETQFIEEIELPFQ